MKKLLLLVVCVFFTHTTFAQIYNINDLRYKESRAYTSFNLAWQSVDDERYYTAYNHINSSLRVRPTVQGLLLKSRIEYLIYKTRGNDWKFISITTYNEAKKLDKIEVFTPPYKCISTGVYCTRKYWEWGLINIKKNEQNKR